MNETAPGTAHQADNTVICWSCKGPVCGRDVFCPVCGAIQPPGQVSPFERFGLSQRFDVDTDALEARFFDLQRRLHPDRFALSGARSLALSQQQAAALNDAYEALRDPVRRAGVLLGLAGREVPGTDTHTIHDPELLMEAMEMREALQEADSTPALMPLIDQTRKHARSCEQDLAAAFEDKNYEAAARLMLRLRYLLKLNEEIRARRTELARRG